MGRYLLVLCAACWTGTVPEPAPVHAPQPVHHPGTRLEITLARTLCFGNCPVFRIAIDHAGHVEYTGERYVEVTGKRTMTLQPGDLDAIDEAITQSKFFERDAYGQLVVGPSCVHSGNSMSCSFQSSTICSDTSHTIITVKRGARSHKIDNAHCTDQEDALNNLENEILDRTHVRDWIGKN